MASARIGALRLIVTGKARPRAISTTSGQVAARTLTPYRTCPVWISTPMTMTAHTAAAVQSSTVHNRRSRRNGDTGSAPHLPTVTPQASLDVRPRSYAAGWTWAPPAGW